MEARSIESITAFNTDSVDATKKEITSLEGETIKYDYLFLTPPTVCWLLHILLNAD